MANLLGLGSSSLPSQVPNSLPLSPIVAMDAMLGNPYLTGSTRSVVPVTLLDLKKLGELCSVLAEKVLVVEEPDLASIHSLNLETEAGDLGTSQVPVLSRPSEADRKHKKARAVTKAVVVR